MEEGIRRSTSGLGRLGKDGAVDVNAEMDGSAGRTRSSSSSGVGSRLLLPL